MTADGVDVRRGGALGYRLPGVRIAVVTVLLLAGYDAWAGPHITLAGLLTVGPCLAASSAGWRAVAAVGAFVVVLTLLVSFPDQIWWSTQQLLYLIAMVIVTTLSATVAERRAEQERRLLVAEAQFAGAFEVTTIGMALIEEASAAVPGSSDPTCNKLLAANPALTRICRWNGGPPPAAVGDLIRLRAEGPQDRETVFPDGDVLVAVVTSTDLPFRAGGQALRLVQVEDVTAQRRARQALKDQADALARSNAELQQFAYVASHDLQEPLRKVASYVQVLAADYAEVLDDQALEYIGFAVDGAQRMRCLIDDLLAVSRLRIDAMTVQDCDLGALVQVVLEDYSQAVSDANATVDLGDLPVIPGDQTHLRQLFQNLVSNAIKYRRRDVPLVLRISAERDHESWVFTVSDNGIGFKQEYADKVFAMFQRLVSRSDYEGTGMGLAIAAKVVENHGGRIWVQSQPGVGTTFSFSLPASVPKTRAHPGAAPAADGRPEALAGQERSGQEQGHRADRTEPVPAGKHPAGRGRPR